MLFFSISSVSSQSLNDFDGIDDGNDNNVLKSDAKSIAGTGNLSASAKVKTSTLSTANKVNANTAKVTNVKANTTKKTNSSTANKKTKSNASAGNKKTKSNASAGNKKTVSNATTVNKKTLAKTSASFMNSVEKNGKFPKVKISNRNYSNTEYLYLISKAVENNSKTKIEMKKNLVKPYNNTKCKSAKGTINKGEYVKIASKTRKFIEKNKRAPNWESSSKGNIPYNQLILVFSKCLDTYNKTNKLPNSIKLDDLDLDVMKSKINKSSKSATAKTASLKKANITTTNKTKTNATSKSAKIDSGSNSGKIDNGANSEKNNDSNSKIETETVEDSIEKINENMTLAEKSLDYVHNILNDILNRLDPSKIKIDLTKSDEGNVKLNTSKINLDLSGKSSVNVKISSKNATANTKTTTANKTKTTTKTTTQKTNSTSTKKASTKTASKTTAKKTNTAKSKSAKKTTNKKTNSTSTKKASTKASSKTAKAKTTKTIAESLKKYLASAKNCQVNNKQIKNFAKKLTSSLKTDYEKGKRLFEWVRDNIEYDKYRNTKRGALKTLQNKKGNCVDQSHLLIALSRAAGIPARYVNANNCRFTSGFVSGHVWTQLYINKKWTVADTTSSKNSLGSIKNWDVKNYSPLGTFSSINF